MNKILLSAIRPLVYLFFAVTAISLAGGNWLSTYQIDNRVLGFGNTLLFLVSMLAFFLMARSLRDKNPQAFVRAIYGGFMIRFFVVMVAAFAYIMVVKKDVNKMGLAALALLYIVYTALEIRGLNRLQKASKNV